MQLTEALEKTLTHLRTSGSSVYSHLSVEQIVQEIETQLAKIQNSQAPDLWQLGLLYAPTGALQDTAIDNGWGDEFLVLASIVDTFMKET